ncbi:MAG: hypothetical protein COW03_17265 [Cytophagales bacterium CG12_big_fil_rev_8_21_14_0_65_40_12]|nr:MAG: hypothetical protein COW03_17265 [Cytophagales bacterium CG12_big_fil_rev_8_21_14_0_65_40_12]PIW02957.1 MAG: hypothetical protein COW40_16530 [Cytophagales bacterium CG17_big_fil_post_rev_8_21_14_2_50_40_13]
MVTLFSMFKVNPALSKLAIKYGVVAALFTVLAFVVFYIMGQQPWRNLVSFLLDVFVIGVFLFLAIKDYKDSVNNGALRFYQGMTVGFIVYLTIAAGFSLFFFVLMQWVEPDFLGEYIKLALEDLVSRREMIVAGLSEESYLDQYSKLQNTTIGVLVIDAFVKRLLIGLVLTPIFSVLLRTHQA